MTTWELAKESGRVAQQLEPAWQVVVGAVLIAVGGLFAWKKTHITFFSGIFGESAFPWRGWIRTVVIYWAPGVMLIFGFGMITTGISALLER
jgi:hypothetical protein